MASLVTLREFSKKHNVKKPTANARLKKIERDNPEKTLTVKKDNVIYLTESGLALLEESFKDNPVKASARGKKKKRRANNEPVKEKSDDVIKLYREQIQRLEEALEASRRDNERLLLQIDKLTAVVTELTGAVSVALKDSQRLISQEQSLALIEKTGTSENKTKKKSLFARLAVAGKVLKGGYD